jgi:hypothetical protein
MRLVNRYESGIRRRYIRRLLEHVADEPRPYRVKVFRDGKGFLSDRQGIIVHAHSAREALEIATQCD